MKIGIIRCQEASKTCAGYHCFPAMRGRTGEFKKYDTVELVGFDTCGGCSPKVGERIVARALDLKNNGAEVIHLAVCTLYTCPHREINEMALKEKVGLPIVKGTHPHKPIQEMGAQLFTLPPTWFFIK